MACRTARPQNRAGSLPHYLLRVTRLPGLITVVTVSPSLNPMDQIATVGQTPLPARPLTTLHRGALWYLTAAYYIVAAQTAALLVLIASLRTQAQEHLAAQHGLDASIARGLAFFLTLGTATAGDVQRQRLLASAIRFETTTVSHLAWFLCWMTVFFLTVTVAANRDSPTRFTVGTIRRLIGVSLIFL